MSQTHNIKQGSSQWLAFRRTHFGASEAPAMLGISPYKSRDKLLREKATGITPEVDENTQRLFDEGHRLEAEARPIAEKIIGEDLFTPTMSLEVDGLNLSCSCDGLTLMQDVLWECKTLNNKLREALPGTIPESYHPQLEQMMLITGAEKALFMAYDGTVELHCWYKSNPELRKRIISGWKQFAEDMKNNKEPAIKAETMAQSIESLPALNVQIEGGVTRSNLDAYKTTALRFIAAINTDLQTDQDFADADAMVKFCGKTEKELDAVKTAALNQTADIADLFSTIDTLKAEMRSKRLMLDKLVKSRKMQVKEEIVQDGRREFFTHCNKLNERLHDTVSMPDMAENFAGVIKNKRTIESLHNAVNSELARCKIEANEIADSIDANVKALMELSENKYAFLFSDIQQIITKPKDDLLNLAKMRIADHNKAEAVRLEAERERIRAEEQAKAEAVERERADASLKANAIAQAKKKRDTEEDQASYDNAMTASEVQSMTEGKNEEGLEFCDTKEDSEFDKWWRLSGSGIIPYADEDTEEFAQRIACIAWGASETTRAGRI